MAYFGNSTDQAHSILAGYQRRANQLQARSTSRYNVGVNLGSVSDRINAAYSNRLSRPYGDSKVLRDRVNTWADYSENEVNNAQNKLTQAKDRIGALNAQLSAFDTLHNAIQQILIKINDGNQSVEDMKSYGNMVQQVRGSKPVNVSSYEVDLSSYDVDNVEKMRKKITDAIGTAMSDKVLAKEAIDKVNKVQNSVHLKAVEDFMVDGRLMRESKTALVITPLTAIAVVGVGLWAYRQFFRTKSPVNFSGSNKSAAVAVFG